MYAYLGMLCLSLLVSCELLRSTEEQTQQGVREALSTLNWNEVDQYPLFESCDETAPKAVQRQCFQTALLTHFSQALAGLQLQAAHALNDTVYLHLAIDAQGAITVIPPTPQTPIPSETDSFTTAIATRLQAVAPVKPAIKRGIPVRLRLTLPVVLHTP